MSSSSQDSFDLSLSPTDPFSLAEDLDFCPLPLHTLAEDHGLSLEELLMYNVSVFASRPSSPSSSSSSLSDKAASRSPSPHARLPTPAASSSQKKFLSIKNPKTGKELPLNLIKSQSSSPSPSRPPLNMSLFQQQQQLPRSFAAQLQHMPLHHNHHSHTYHPHHHHHQQQQQQQQHHFQQQQQQQQFFNPHLHYASLTASSQ
ncbi:hypothetical protein RI367_004973 [Sorochytrium milnesiophthora]